MKIGYYEGRSHRYLINILVMVVSKTTEGNNGIGTQTHIGALGVGKSFTDRKYINRAIEEMSARIQKGDYSYQLQVKG